MRHIDVGEMAVAACGTAEHRGSIEVLRTRAHLLADRDRALLEMYLEHGNSLRQIGRVMGLTPMTVGRRIRRILRRLADNTYEICLGNHDDFNGRELALIKDYFVRGSSERSVSRHRGVTIYRVKTTIQKARRYAASKRRENP
jgi:DNA-binding CsgD family transcriptional regulator